MDESSNPLIELRVLHGPQAGARLALATGREYVLGVLPECDVMLIGPRVAPRHAVIALDGDGAHAEALEGNICDAQSDPFTGKRALALGTPLELGGIWITVDDVAAPWPEAEAVLSAIDKRNEPATGDAATQATAAIESGGDNAAAVPPQPPRTARRSLPFKVLLALSFILLSGAGTAAWVMADQPDAEQAEKASGHPSGINAAPQGPPPAIVKAIGDQGLSDALQVSRSESGSWTVTGYLRTAASRDALAAALEKTAPQAVLHVFVDEEITAEAKEALLANPASGREMLRVENSGGGKLRLTGAATNAELVAEAAKTIQSRVSGVRSIDAAALLPDQLAEQLKMKLSEAGLSDRLRFAKKDREIVLSGDLTNDEVTRWETLFVEFGRTYGSVLPIRAVVGDHLRTVDLDVKTIVGGQIPYVVTRHGERVNQGGSIHGRTLVTIRAGDVIFDGNQHLQSMR